MALVNLTRRFWARGLAFGALCLVLAAYSPVAYGQASGWSEPLPISPQGQFAWWPDLAVDLGGRLHLAYASGIVNNRVTYDAVMYMYSDDGRTWSDPNDIFALDQPAVGESAATRPTLLVDNRNDLHITFTDYFGMFYSQAWAGQASRARSWSAVQDLGFGQPVYYSWMREDSGQRLHFILTENVYSRNCPICYHIFYRFSDDYGKTWAPAVDVSKEINGVVRPQMLIDPQDNLHLVWDAGRGGALGQLSAPTSVRYAASYDRGATWTAPLEFTSPFTATDETDPATVPQARDVTLGLDGQGQLVMAWVGLPDALVYYLVSGDEGRTWSDPQPIPGVVGRDSTLDTYSMATDSAGHIHLFMVGRVPNPKETSAAAQRLLSVIHLEWDGSAWSKPDVLRTYDGDAPEWPQVAVRFGNQLHVVWFVRNKETLGPAGGGADSSNARFQVWYTSKTVAGPEIPPGPTPTFAPTVETPSAAVETAVPQTPTPAPTRFQLTSVPTEGIYREDDYLVIAGASILPVLVLIAVAVVFVRQRRRRA